MSAAKPKAKKEKPAAAKAKKGKPEAPAAEATLPPIPPPPDGGWPVEEIPLDKLKLDNRLQSRWEAWDTKNSYMDNMIDGFEFPPVEVVRDAEGVNWVWDGFHRLSAAKGAKRETFKARVRPGDFRLAQRLSLSANSQHGLPRTNYDKRKTVDRALGDKEWSKLSTRALGELCGVSHAFIAKVRQEMEKEEKARKEVAKANKEAVKQVEKELPEATHAAIAEHKAELSKYQLEEISDKSAEVQPEIVKRLATGQVNTVHQAVCAIKRDQSTEAFRSTLAEFSPGGPKWAVVEDLDGLDGIELKGAWIETRQDLRPLSPGAGWQERREQPLALAIDVAGNADYVAISIRVEDLPGLFCTDEYALSGTINARDDGYKGVFFLSQVAGELKPLEKFLGPTPALLALSNKGDLVLLCGHTSDEAALDFLREGRDVVLWHPEEEVRERLRKFLEARSRKGVA